MGVGATSGDVAALLRRDGRDELDALFEEARRRARRRRFRNALLVAALAAGGLYAAFGHGGGGGGSSADGRSASGGAGRPAGHAPPQPYPDAPRSQRFPLFGRCPLAPSSRYLPRRAGCLSVRRGDVDGDGRTDLVLLYARLDSHGFPRPSGRGGRDRFTLKVVRAAGEALTLPVPADLNTTILRVRSLDARPGAELLIHETHVTTEEELGVYTFDGTRLRRARGFLFDGSDAGIVFGVTCHRRPGATIVQHSFTERIPFRGVWDRTDTTYRWERSRLREVSAHKTEARPTRSQIGVHC